MERQNEKGEKHIQKFNLRKKKIPANADTLVIKKKLKITPGIKKITLISKSNQQMFIEHPYIQDIKLDVKENTSMLILQFPSLKIYRLF